MITSEMNTLRRALERYRRIAWQHRRGGLADDYNLAQEALTALEKIRQPKLFEDTNANTE